MLNALADALLDRRQKREESRHRRAMLHFYRGFVSPGDLCFDIGANLGNRTDVLLELGARVVAVEPQSSCVEQLRSKYGRNDRVVIISEALGSREGEADLAIASEHTISSMSPEWIESVRESGRFSSYDWSGSERVAVTTLDSLIQEYGRPIFCKIDVEGYEFEVLRGLSGPLPCISFEFTPEYIRAAVKSVEHLSALGSMEFNYVVGESMRLVLADWVDKEDIVRILTSLPDSTVFGDVYVRPVRKP